MTDIFEDVYADLREKRSFLKNALHLKNIYIFRRRSHGRIKEKLPQGSKAEQSWKSCVIRISVVGVNIVLFIRLPCRC